MSDTENAKTVLITGANGLWGMSVTRSLLKRGHRVFALVRDSTAIKHENLTPVPADLATSWDVCCLPRRADVVIHLAQSNRFRDFPEGSEDVFNVNISTTAKLLDYARRAGASQFIYASTGGVYSPAPGQLDENAPIHDQGRLGSYFGSKLCGEILVHSYRPYFTTTILRPFFIYGPGQKRSMHLARIFDHVRSKEKVQLQGSQGISINPIHVEDAAAVVLAVMARPLSAVVNVAGRDVYSIRQIAEAIGQFLGAEPRFEISDTPADNLIADISLMQSALFQPTRSLMEHIADVAI